ncbi:hypothetical protein GGR52DRAFT_537957 [Hypoxylon sp. FL1284]|nr:hypothetical protein GGR52DRAFT_537957 [Hypoxylon sp. FL1284]
MSKLERLERFFSASRRKDKEKGAKYRDDLVVSTPSQSDNDLHFPSPTFMRPTSAHMRPRVEHVSRSKGVKDRSQSLPDSQSTSRSRSSIDSAGIALSPRQQPIDLARMLSLPISQLENPLSDQRLSHIKFSSDPFKKKATAGPSRQDGSLKGEVQGQNMLDWHPQRLSSLFKTLGLETSIDDRITRSTETVKAPSAMKPSSRLSTPPSPKTMVAPIIQRKQSSQEFTEVPARNPAFLPRQDVLSSVARSYPDSPPASDGEDEDLQSSFHPKAQKGLAPPIEFTPRPSIESKIGDNTEAKGRRGPSKRESWGARPHDLASITPRSEEDKTSIRSRSLRKSVSESSLLNPRSTVARHAESGKGISEPTLDDFYALEDEDVAETILAAPESDTDVPPIPPPKDSPRTIIGRSRSTRHMPIAPISAIESSSGELTPLCTPTNSQFLALTYSPTHTSGELGAMWAAEIARTYNFDLVYVISLWPKDAGIESDPSRRSTSSRGTPQRSGRGEESIDSVATTSPIVAGSKSRMNGRLLTGYGLDKFGSPFRVHAQFHTKMLGFSGWQEYRDELASSNMISRGWTCSFYGDRVPSLGDGSSQGHGKQGGIANRGIVFAAYSRKMTRSAIPVRPSPKQMAILGRLFYDAQTLVDALVHGV